MSKQRMATRTAEVQSLKEHPNTQCHICSPHLVMSGLIHRMETCYASHLHRQESPKGQSNSISEMRKLRVKKSKRVLLDNRNLDNSAKYEGFAFFQYILEISFILISLKPFQIHDL